MSRTIVILTEGGQRIGLGHVSRCAALASAFKAHGARIKFVLRGDETALAFLESQGFRGHFFDWEEDLVQTKDLVSESKVVVVDSYIAELPFYNWLSTKVSKLLVLDDFFRLPFPERAFILNPVAEPDGNPFHLFGLQYALLRPAFWEVPEREVRDEVYRVLITFGGEDLRGLTPLVVRVVSQVFPEAECAVVVGPAFANQNLVVEEGQIKIYRNLSAKKMRDLMLSSDVAVSAGGQTLFELIRTGTPTVSVLTAENQRLNVKRLEATELIQNAGNYDHPTISKNIETCLLFWNARDARQRLCLEARRILDGKGPQRVVETIWKA